TGSVNISSLNINSNSASIENDGVISFSGNSPITGSFVNNGTYNVSGDFNLNSGTVAFTNSGTINVSNSFNISNGFTATN
ncbi:hypothetical protein NL450_27370, partial [Klebsiella pneumoniae]|nr:hypothetical protein [Klebsiella pneumoniae]